MPFRHEEADVTRYVAWSSSGLTCPRTLRRIIRLLKRFIDFDGTITVPTAAGIVARGTLRGMLLGEDLAETPHAVQTWNPVTAMRFFLEDRPELPRPELILIAPMCDVVDDEGRFVDVGKDLGALGIRGADVIDDMPAASILAPGCVILPP